jgi:hypothetical protein
MTYQLRMKEGVRKGCSCDAANDGVEMERPSNTTHVKG